MASVGGGAADAKAKAAAKASKYADGVVIPGDRLGQVTEFQPGVGTYIRGDHLHACVVGVKRVSAGGAAADDLPVLTVTRSWGEAKSPLVPAVGDTVTCRVLRINASVASLGILCVGERAITESFSGLLRKENVRKHEVISLGDRRSYFLSTVDEDKGVVHAVGDAGEALLPLSPTMMQCPVTRVKVPRKVAVIPAPPAAE